MKNVNLLLLVVFLLGVGCDDFFKEESQNKAYVQTMADLNELLIGEGYIDVEGLQIWGSNNTYIIPRNTDKYFPWIHLMDDDITHFADGGYYLAEYNTLFPTTQRLEAAYGWQSNPFVDQAMTEYAPTDWKNAYKRIAVLNSIITMWDDIAASEPDKKYANRVKGETYFLRAYNYFWLTNVYAQPYATATAENEPGIPLKLSEEVEDRFFSRNSLKEVYEQIRSDLEVSIDAFREAEEPARPVKANYGAACLLMSRICLYTEDYKGAIAYADSVLSKRKYGLLDLTAVDVSDPRTADVVYEASPETIFTQGVYIIPGIMQREDVKDAQHDSYAVSRELMDLYHEDDQRLKTYFISSVKFPGHNRCWKLRTSDARLGDYMLMRFPEIYLNKAEALAISGDEEGAKATLNVLRENRFESGKMPSIEAEMQVHGNTDLVSFVRDERRRELCFEGHRWFDLRRYAVNTKVPFSKTIRHDKRVWEGGEEDGRFVTFGYYELKPYAEDRAAYALPLPGEEIIFNEGILKPNEARPERNIIPY